MIELESPQIAPVEELGSYAKYEASPLPAGYGVTLGNALRRVLLSSLEGAAVTAIQIRDVYHEFTSIPGVKEDVTQIVLNVKKLRLKSFATHPVQLKLIKSGAGMVTAADIQESADVEVVNPELELMTLDSDDVTIEMDLTVEKGVGYLAAERAESNPIGVIPVDAIFTPVRKVNYSIENTRVGQMTNYDKLTIELETDGTISPEEALGRAADTQALSRGDFKKAAEELQKLKKQLADKQLDAGKKEELAKQLHQVEKKLKQMADAAQAAQGNLQKQIDQLRRDGTNGRGRQAPGATRQAA